MAEAMDVPKEEEPIVKEEGAADDVPPADQPGEAPLEQMVQKQLQLKTELPGEEADRVLVKEDVAVCKTEGEEEKMEELPSDLVKDDAKEEVMEIKEEDKEVKMEDKEVKTEDKEVKTEVEEEMKKDEDPREEGAESGREAEEDGGEEGEEQRNEKKLGILQQPLVVDGKRKRESTSFFKAEDSEPHHRPTIIGAGSGLALGDIPFVFSQLAVEKNVEDLRPFYWICYAKNGRKDVIRKELRQFNGFPFARDSLEYTRKRAAIVKQRTLPELKHISRILGMPNYPTKDEQVQAVLDFLMAPHAVDKKVPAMRASRSSVGKPKAKTPAKTPAKKTPSKAKKVDDESGDETPKATPKKRKAVSKAKTPAKKAKTEPEDGAEEGAGDATKDAHSDSEESSETEVEKEKKLDPLDDEVKGKITNLLMEHDLTTMSMNQVLSALFTALPDRPSLQLQDNKLTIKNYIKALITEVPIEPVM